MLLSSWAPRAKILPSQGEWWAEKGRCNHLAGSAGTESRWELRRMEGREGLVLEGEKWRILVVRFREWDWDWRKEMAEE